MVERQSRSLQLGIEPSLSNVPVLSWKQLLNLVQKPPWEMTRTDVESFRDLLTARGKATSTICAQLSNINSFYRWCSRRALDSGCGEHYNPAAGVHRPALNEFATTDILSAEEAEPSNPFPKGEGFEGSARGGRDLRGGVAITGICLTDASPGENGGKSRNSLLNHLVVSGQRYTKITRHLYNLSR